MAKKTTTADGKEPTGKEIRLPADSTMKGFSSAVNGANETIGEAKDELKEAADEAKKKHLALKPFRLAKDLHDSVKDAKNESTAAEKLALFLAQFDHARKFFKLDELANLQGRMFGTGEIGGEPARETQEDGMPDDRPRHLRQPGASVSSPVAQMAAKAGAQLKNPIDQVGRGKPDGEPGEEQPPNKLN